MGAMRREQPEPDLGVSVCRTDPGKQLPYTNVSGDRRQPCIQWSKDPTVVMQQHWQFSYGAGVVATVVESRGPNCVCSPQGGQGLFKTFFTSGSEHVELCSCRGNAPSRGRLLVEKWGSSCQPG